MLQSVQARTLRNENSANSDVCAPREIWRVRVNNKEWITVIVRSSIIIVITSTISSLNITGLYVCPSHNGRLQIHIMFTSSEANARLKGHTRPHAAPNLNHFVYIWYGSRSIHYTLPDTGLFYFGPHRSATSVHHMKLRTNPVKSLEQQVRESREA